MSGGAGTGGFPNLEAGLTSLLPVLIRTGMEKQISVPGRAAVRYNKLGF